ncbi:MAG: ATP-binding protein [Elsteraceae bacterium]
MSGSSWKRRTDRISLRIVGTVILSLAAVVFLAALLILNTHRSGVSMYSGPWLLKQIEEAARTGRSESLALSVETSMPIRDDTPLPHQILRRQIAERLGMALSDISLTSTLFVDEVARPPRFVPVPAEQEDPTAWDPSQIGVMVPGGMVIGLKRPDGSWLRLATRGANDRPERATPILVWLALVGVAIAVPSIWTARNLVRPLEDLAAAAERIGIDRTAPTIAETGPEELRTIAQAFNRMGARLKRFVDDRTQMIAAISHDLRTPITRMRLRAEFVVDPEQQARMLRDLAEMEQMVASTLAFSSSDARQEERVLTDVAALIADICEDAAETGAEVSYVGPYHASLACQPMALRRVVTNLIDNALRHGSPPVTVTVTDEKDAVLIDVADRGPGIPAAEHERVLQPFIRLEPSRNRETGGTGLGLTIARTIVHAHGGSMTLINLRPRGLQVRLLIPKALREPAAPAKDGAAGP